MQRSAPKLRAACATLIVLAALLLLRRTLAGIDAGATLSAVVDAGRWSPLALAPCPVAMGLDAVGIGILLRTLGRSVPVRQLLPIRIASEALHLTAPAGFVVADSATAALLEARCGVPLAEGAVLAIARKWLVMRAHATYILLGAACGSGALGVLSLRLFGGRWLVAGVAGLALVPLALSMGVGAGFSGSPLISRLQTALCRLPWLSLRSRVARWRNGAVQVDVHLARIGSARSATWLAAAAFLGGWLCESIETCIIVRLVGGPLDLSYAMAAEVGFSLVRSVGNVAPAGLGIQDAGYVALFQAMGLPGHTTAAFVLLKRAKEVLWISIGYILLAAMRRPVAAVGQVPGAIRSASARLVRRVA